jgi:hypothetical protein
MKNNNKRCIRLDIYAREKGNFISAFIFRPWSSEVFKHKLLNGSEVLRCLVPEFLKLLNC